MLFRSVLKDVRVELKRATPPASLSIFYGAGHMEDLERRLRREFGYRAESDLWLPAFTVDYAKAGLSVIEATPEAETAYAEEVASLVENSLMNGIDSWFWGTNVEGKKRSFLMYAGGVPAFREKCAEVARNHYTGFSLA